MSKEQEMREMSSAPPEYSEVVQSGSQPGMSTYPEQYYPPQQAQVYPEQPYPPQGYPPGQQFPPQVYPGQQFPPQNYPGHQFPPQGYQEGQPPLLQGYPTQQYPMAMSPAGYPAPPPYVQNTDPTMCGMVSPTSYQTQYAAQPGYYPGQPAQQPMLTEPQPVEIVRVANNPVESHMLLSVLATLCCCWPIGIFAIIKSMEVSNALSRGDRSRAETSSARAYQLAKYAFIAGLATFILGVIFLIVRIASSDLYN